jgi:hypothetical protein
MQRPDRSQSPKRVGSGPARPPISRGSAGCPAAVAAGVARPPARGAAGIAAFTAGDATTGAEAAASVGGERVGFSVDIGGDDATILQCITSE